MQEHPTTVDSPFLTTQQLADRWQTTPQSIANMRHRGSTPPGYKIGGRVLYRVDEVLDFEQSLRSDPTVAA